MGDLIIIRPLPTFCPDHFDWTLHLTVYIFGTHAVIRPTCVARSILRDQVSDVTDIVSFRAPGKILLSVDGSPWLD
jgi:hypothetical protein